MKLKDLIKAPPAEGYIKNSSNLVTALFILAGILYYPTNGYGSVIALAAALIVLVGQKMLIGQTNKDFADMQFAEKQFTQTQNADYARFIQARATQILNDNKVLSEKGKKELTRLLKFAETTLAENTSPSSQYKHIKTRHSVYPRFRPSALCHHALHGTAWLATWHDLLQRGVNFR